MSAFVIDLPHDSIEGKNGLDELDKGILLLIGIPILKEGSHIEICLH